MWESISLPTVESFDVVNGASLDDENEGRAPTRAQVAESSYASLLVFKSSTLSSDELVDHVSTTPMQPSPFIGAMYILVALCLFTICIESPLLFFVIPF